MCDQDLVTEIRTSKVAYPLSEIDGLLIFIPL